MSVVRIITVFKLFFQHVDVVQDRALTGPNRLFHSQQEKTAKPQQQPDTAQSARSLQNGVILSKSNMLRPLPKNCEESFGSGALYHAFGFRSAYKHFPGTQAVSLFSTILPFLCSQIKQFIN